MEMYIDKHTRAVMKFIKRRDGCSVIAVYEKFSGESTQLLKDLSKAGYLVYKNVDETVRRADSPFNAKAEDSVFLSPKGNKYLEDRFDRLWQWAIPTGISILALVISIVSAVHPGIIRVMLVGP